ncbi:hypothetical protein [Pseudomonas pohangensis]|nr:hypothetical protein [Pseudomonas pohangensis]
MTIVALYNNAYADDKMAQINSICEGLTVAAKFGWEQADNGLNLSQMKNLIDASLKDAAQQQKDIFKIYAEVGHKSRMENFSKDETTTGVRVMCLKKLTS